MARDAVNVLFRELLGDPAFLGNGALVGPDDGAAQRSGRFVQRRTAHHLPAEDDAGHRVAAYPALLQKLARGGAHSPPPIRRMLLGPAGVSVLGAVAVKGAADHAASVVVERGFITRRSQVVSQNIALHTRLESPSSACNAVFVPPPYRIVFGVAAEPEQPAVKGWRAFPDEHLGGHQAHCRAELEAVPAEPGADEKAAARR